MQLKFLPLACLIGSALAAPVRSKTQDTKAVNLAIQHVTDALKRLDGAFNNFNTRNTDRQSQMTQVNELINLDHFVQSELKTGTGVLQRDKTSVGAVEALSLVNPVAGITDLVTKVTDGWQGPAKKVINNLGKRDAVLRELLDTQKASQDFSDALIAKLPYAYQYIGSTGKTQNTRLIQGAIDDYR